MANNNVNLSEVLVTPLVQMIQKISEGVSQAQRNLDMAALETQAKLKETHPQLAEIGYQVPWYQMPTVEVELKMVVHYEEQRRTDNQLSRKVYLAPFNAKYKNAFTYDAQGSSTLKLKIVPIPAPTISVPEG